MPQLRRCPVPAWRFVIGTLIGVGVWIGLGTLAVAQAPPRKVDFRETLHLDVDSSAVKRLAAAREHLQPQVKQWAEGIEILQQVAQEQGDSLVAVAEGRYVNVRTYCRMQLANMPPAGLQVYRGIVDPGLRATFERGRAERNSDLLQQVLRQGFAGTYGDDALLLLGEIAWEAGEIARARGYWEQILPLPADRDPTVAPGWLAYPDTNLDLAAVRARLILCSVMLGQTDRARRELQSFTALHGEARGPLAGQDGRYVEILEELAGRAEQQAVTPADDVATFGLNSARNSVLPAGLDVGGLQWSVPLPLHPAQVLGRRAAFWPEKAPGYFPVIFRDPVRGPLVLVNDAETVFAWQLLSGRPAYLPAGTEPQPDDPVLYPPLVTEKSGPGREQRNRTMGIPRFTMTLAEGRLYVRMGELAVSGGPAGLRDETSRLVCLDLAHGQGAAIWETAAADLDLGGGRWAFEGSPVVRGEHLFVGLRRLHPQPQCNVACFEAETGRFVWNRVICRGAGNISPEHREISHQLLTLAEDTLYYSTNLGVIAALDPLNGVIRWAATYEHLDDDDTGVLAERLEAGLNPCLFHNGIVYTAPADSRKVLAYEASTGMLLWERQFQRQVQALLGVAEGNLIATGDRLWALDADTGHVNGELGEDDPEGATFGRGVLAGDLIYWPRREELWIVRQRRAPAGALMKAREVRMPGGNLAIMDGFLLVAEPERLSAYCEYTRLKEQLERIVTENPDDPAARLRLAEVADALRENDAALEHYREALQRAGSSAAEPDAGLASQIRSRLLLLLTRLGEAEFARGEFPSAERRFSEIITLAVEPADRTLALLRLADSRERRADFSGAIMAWQQILDQATLRELWFSPGNAPAGAVDDYVIRRMAETIQRQGPGVYAPLETAAAQLFATAAQREDEETLRALLRRFPHASATGTAGILLADRLADRGDGPAAMAVWRNLLRLPVDEPVRISASVLLAGMLERGRAQRAADEVWQNLLAVAPDSLVPDSDPPQTVRDVAGRHLPLNGTPITSVNAEVSDLHLPWRRRWQQAVDEESPPLVPEGRAPSADLACVLVAQDGWTCRNATDGAVRWSVLLESRLVWASYEAEQLLLGTTRQLRSVSLETGRTLWEWKLDRVDRPPAHDTRLVSPPPPFAAREDEELHAFQCVGGLVYCLSGRSRLWAFQGTEGRLLWTYAQMGGALEPLWRADSQRLVLQGRQPDELVVLDPASGRKLVREPGSATPWERRPLILKNGSVLTIDGDNQIRCGCRPNQQPAWTYAGPVSQAHARPDALTNGERIVLVIDGHTLVEVDPETGLARWQRRLGSDPLMRAEWLGAMDGDRLYLASGGILRSFHLADGTLAWERSLGDQFATWRTVQVGRSIAAYPLGVTGEHGTVVVCDAASGEEVQRLRIDGPVRTLMFHAAPEISLLAGGGRLLGLGKW